jgi:4-amino-4-deoxy-L-arabinose transferase-like glycosyltransferase
MSLTRRWPVIALFLLLPLWCVGVFYRGSWTPDEPRESNIAWNMQHQENRALPELAGTPFLEKPPLSYWMAAGANSLLGNSLSPRAQRVPNLIYAAIIVLALGALAAAMAGTEAALLASVLGGSMLLMLRVSIWLAPDASLTAGCSLALLGAYLGYTAKPGTKKLLAYTLMHAGAAIGFMAKSAPGWIVPALALLALIVWEKRWSELRRPELYAGLVLQALFIGFWLWEVWTGPDGRHALRVLFLDNLAGRFGTVASADGTRYSESHQNWPGRYLLELPPAFLPWTFLIVAALRSGWRRFRAKTLDTPWRFALCASLPFLALLSVASTARDVYAAPAIPGLALAVALWALDLPRALDRFDAFALKATRVTLAVMIVVLAIATLIIAAANDVALIAVIVVPTLIGLIAVWVLATGRRTVMQGNYKRDLQEHATKFVLAAFLTSLFVFPAIDRWQNLPAIAQAIVHDTQGKPIALFSPDETTIAMLDSVERASASVTLREPSAVTDWFCTHPDDGRLVVHLPGSGPGEISRLFRGIGMLREKPAGDGDAAMLEHAGVARMLQRYEAPQGRRYAVMGAGSMPCDHRA